MKYGNINVVRHYMGKQILGKATNYVVQDKLD